MGTVKVNVGGVVFETTADTLSRIPYFGDRRGNGWANANASAGANASATETPFIDRDPEAFRAILNWARDPQYVIPAQWAPEVAFYCIPAAAVDIPPWMAGATPPGHGHRNANVVFYRASDHVHVTHIVWDDYTCDGIDVAVANDMITPHRRELLRSYAASIGMQVSAIPHRSTVNDDQPNVYFSGPIDEYRMWHIDRIPTLHLNAGYMINHVYKYVHMHMRAHMDSDQPTTPVDIGGLLWRDYGELPICRCNRTTNARVYRLEQYDN